MNCWGMRIALQEIMRQGAEKAKLSAAATMKEVREAMGFTY